MENLLRRVRSAIGRTADRISGQHVPVEASDAPLENRRLARPPVDVFESDREVVIVADVPGAFQDNTKVHWSARSGLSVHVVRAEESSALVWGERLDEDWYRTFALPEHLDESDARASIERGVLTIRIPKQATPAPISIPITAS